jgi:hypothetical protein
MAKIVSESRFEKGPCRCIERLAGRVQNFVNNRRRFRAAAPAGGCSPLNQRLSRISILSFGHIRRGHLHDLFRYPVCFLLVWIARLIDGELRLDRPAVHLLLLALHAWPATHCVGAAGTFALEQPCDLWYGQFACFLRNLLLALHTYTSLAVIGCVERRDRL